MKLNRYELPIKDVTWNYPLKINASQNDNKRVELTCSTQSIDVVIYLSFPKSGGVRIYSEKFGFFAPDDLCDLVKDGNKYIAENGASIEIADADDGFKFICKDADSDNTYVLNTKDMLIGMADGKWIKAGLNVALDSDEQISGFGERFNTQNHNGTDFTLWNFDCWSTENHAYKNMPIWHSTKGYMAFFNSAYSCEVNVGLADKKQMTLEFEGDIWDIYIFLGAPLKCIKEYTGLTGCPILPPDWALRYWCGAGFQYWESRGQDKYLDVISDTLETYEKLGVKNMAAMGGEGLPFHNQPSYDILKKYGTRMIAWHHPSHVMDEMKEWLGTDDLFKIPYLRDPEDWTKQAHREVLDYSHPNAKKIISRYFKDFWDWGVKGCMVDYGEILPPEAVSFDGHTGDELHNFISYWYNKAYCEAWTERMGRDHILFSRSGCAGCQKWIGQFGGDQTGTFDGLRRAVNGMLNLTSCGFSVWGTDIGGYGDHESPELYVRWQQFGTFNVLMRAHGGCDRTPWRYGDVAIESFKKCYQLRENIVPAISAACAQAHYTGVPATQMMHIAYPEQNLKNLESQYMFCDDLLVCPVIEEGATKKVVAFPNNNWYNLLTGEKHIGGVTETVDAPIEDIPVFVTSGAILPVDVKQDGWLLDPFCDEDVSRALLITAPDDIRTKAIYNSQGLSKTYTSEPVAENAFSICVPDSNDTDLFLVLGKKIDRVEIDGVASDAEISENISGSRVKILTPNFRKVTFYYSED